MALPPTVPSNPVPQPNNNADEQPTSSGAGAAALPPAGVGSAPTVPTVPTKVVTESAATFTTFETRTNKIFYRLKLIAPKIAILYSYMEQGWTLSEVVESRDTIWGLHAQAGLSGDSVTHCIIIFGMGTQNQSFQQNFSSAARNILNKNKMAANGFFLIIDPPYIVEVFLRVITLGRSSMYLVIRSRSRQTSTDSVALQLETLVTHPAFDSTIKRLALKGAGKLLVEDLAQALAPLPRN
jgi:hypothetical protein